MVAGIALTPEERGVNVEPSEPRHWSGRARQLTALLMVFPIGVAGIIILLIGRDWIGLFLLSAALPSAAITFVPRGVRAVRRLIEHRRARRFP